MLNMGDFNEQICRLCLQITPASESKIIDEIKKRILEILLINLSFHISDCAVACSRCLEKLQDCFEFKSQVMNIGNIKKVFQSETMNKESLCLENVCRLCMSVIENQAFDYTAYLSDEASLRDIIRHCLPEVDLNSVGEALICKRCISSTKKYYEFMKNCQEVEKEILKSKNDDTFNEPLTVKKEYPDDENDMNMMMCSEDEPSTSIKYEEIHIKDELGISIEAHVCSQPDNKVQTTKFHSSKHKDKSVVKMRKCQLCPFSTKHGISLARHQLLHEKPEEIPIYKCANCIFETKHKESLVRHMLRHQNSEAVKIFKCEKCFFVSKWQASLRNHMMSHERLYSSEDHMGSQSDNEVRNVRKTSHTQTSKPYTCRECPYESNVKAYLAQHLLKHKDKSEVKMRKCLLCPFSTKHSRSLIAHQLIHKNPEEIRMYKCANCKFESKYKENLAKHMMKHQNFQAAKILKCEKCSFQTKWQSSLNKHMKNHKYLYRCQKCAFFTNFREDMLKHKLLHQDGEKRIYKCELCSYQAKTGITLKNHIAKIHRDPSVPVLKCVHCFYNTTEKGLLSRHMREQHIGKFKCSSCLYVTTTRAGLRRHSLTHQDVTIKCDYCDFRTKHRGALSDHMYWHDPSKQTSFKCDHCEYHTMKQSFLNRHRLKHMELGEAMIYSCATCDLKTKYKNVLKNHSKICLKKVDKEKMNLVDD